ncbi:hypothetical protein BASA83_003903 [Batrachochytrium salamandrivorans]|nr:hypothetical protein BASA83_003903 [Batrachochytrium salamandrivorans]
MKIARVCQHCGHQIVHRKKSERAVFAFAEMQSFSEGNDVTRPNQIDLTGSTIPRQTRERLLELVQTQAYHKVPVKQALFFKKLGGALLDSCYAKVKSVVDNHIEEMKLKVCLTSDAWSNIKNEPIVNYMLISDSSTFSWNLFRLNLPSNAGSCFIFFISSSDESPTSKSTASREPIWISAVSSNALGFLKGVFQKLEKKVDTFCTASFLPGTSFKGTCKKKESQQKIHDIITDGKFVKHLEKVIMILNPVDTAIVVFQSDSVPVSQIYQSFANTMKQQYESDELFV